MKKGCFTLQQNQDLRSLAAFRILLGTYLIYDIISRLQYGRMSLLWYTSTEDSFLLPDDTPHRSPVHRIWFYRGSENFQLALFGITFYLAVSFTLGYKCGVLSKTFLWLNVVAMQCRCMPPHDGSDAFCRHMLLWCTQLPVSQVWSIDARNNNKLTPGDFDCTTVPNRVAVWGIRLQIVIMYLGTVFHRTIDAYSLSGLNKSKWLPPQLTAVHYALNGSFSTRDCWLGDLVRKNLPLSQFMTLMAILIETFAPIICLVTGDFSHIPAFFLFALHFGLFVLMNLPNWQFIGMLSCVIWLPSWVWDELQRKLAVKFPKYFSPPKVAASPIAMQKKDLLPKTDSFESKISGNEKVMNCHYKLFFSYFFLSYMLLDFGGNRGRIPKIDNGDVGEFLRFSQYWVMFTGPPRTTEQALVTGTLTDTKNVNVYEWIKNGKVEVVDMKQFQEVAWTNMTHVYPSARFERAISHWTPWRAGWRPGKTKHYLNSLCKITPFNQLQMTFQTLEIMTPGSEKRYSGKPKNHVVEVDC